MWGMNTKHLPAEVGDRFHSTDYDTYRIDGVRHRHDYTQLVEITEATADGFAYEVVALVAEMGAPPADFVGRRDHSKGRGTAIWLVLDRWIKVPMGIDGEDYYCDCWCDACISADRGCAGCLHLDDPEVFNSGHELA